MTNMKHGRIHIGTSGWHYKHWMGTFYPEGMKPKDFMDYYLNFFRTVEINNSFYMLPSSQTFANWKNQVPDDFLFAVKASRYITHMKKLKEPVESFNNFIKNVSALEEKLGPILFQLPPGWQYNEKRLADLLEILPTGLRYTFEFRNHTWYNNSALELLQKYNAAFCIYEMEYHMSPIEVTADFVYIRLHGPDEKYAGSYNENALVGWAKSCKKWSQEGKDVFLYFDNDQLGFAAYNAKRILEIVKEVEVIT